MSEEKLVPNIRFESFEGEWELEKLSDKVEYFSGLTYSPRDVSEYGTLVLRSSNVRNKEVVVDDTVYVNPEVVNSNNVQKGDIIMVVRNGSRPLIGKNAVIKKDMPNTVIGAFMTGIRSDTPEYISALLDTHLFKNEIDKNMGATINQITGGMLNKMSFHFPAKEEQISIGKIVSQIDNNIYLESKEIEKLTQYKQAMLQKMFPKEGEIVPEVRFEGFAKEWREATLSDFIQLKNGFAFKSNNYIDDGTYGILTISNVQGNRYISTTEYRKINNLPKDIQDYQILKKGDIVISMTGNVGRVSIVNVDNMLLNQRVGLIKPINEERISKEFLFSILNSKSFEQKMIENGQGAAQLNIGKHDIGKYRIFFPEKREQILIGNYFKFLTTNIETKQAELNKLKQFKQAMLDKMIV